MKNKYFIPLFISLCIILLASCVSAPKHLAKAIKKDKPYVAEQTRLLWPCVVTASDTVNTVDTLYDLIEAQCPDVEYTTPEGKVIYLPGKTTTVLGPTVYKNRYIETKVKDSAEIYLIQNNMEVASGLHKDEIARKDEEIATQDRKIERKNKTLKWLWIALAALAVPYIIKLVRLIKPL